MHLSLVLLILHLWGNVGVSLSQDACSQLPDVPHAQVPEETKKPEYQDGDVIHFTCDPGYRSDRPFVFICRRRRWLAVSRGRCYSIKCKLQVSQLEGSSYEPADRNVFSPGEILRVTCGEKYWISTPQNTSAEVTCRDNGQWTIDPICLEVTCSRPQDQPIYYWDNYWQHKKTLGDTVRYRCRTGYQSTDRATWATCTRGGWTPDPLCQEITCDRREIPNAGIENAKEKYKDYERANYVCNEGYRGRFTLTCRERGWEGQAGCTEITCEPRPHSEADIVNYKTIYKYKEQAQYTCRDGYRGGFSLTCTERGWEGQAACTEITCDRREIPNAAIEIIKEKYTFSERVNYVCNEGYKGRFTLTCRGSGWDGQGECTELADCERPPSVADGDVKYTMKSQYSHNERVEYMCQTYYTMEGEPYKTCLNGEWTGQIRCLKPCIVNEDDFRQHNITLKSSNSKYLVHDEAIEFACARGAPVGAAALRQRCNSGALLLPTCH